MTEELIAKAKEAQSPEELLTLMQENGMEDFTQEEAESFYAQLHTTGELTDEELENVSGGRVQLNVNGQKYRMVSSGTKCFTGKWQDGFTDVTKTAFGPIRPDHEAARNAWQRFTISGKHVCGSCYNLGFTKALTGYCEVEHDS